jgi:O-6-methylguanine DNA methyltransferase
MGTDRKWIVVRIDGKIAAVSTDYRQLAKISALISETSGNRRQKAGKSGRRSRPESEDGNIYSEIRATAVSFEEIWRMKQDIRWDDLMLFGTDFQKQVWKKLWELTHPQVQEGEAGQPELVSYSDFAELCQNRAGVRAVAHAIGLNPISVIIPCHLVIPKESIDKMKEIQKKAEATIFKGDDLCMDSILSDSSIDFGEYSMGRRLKRELILREFR